MLLCSVVVSGAWVVGQVATVVSDSLDDRWATLWVFDAFWHVQSFAILLTICYLWSPSQNNLQYAYMDELGQEEDIPSAEADDSH